MEYKKENFDQDWLTINSIYEIFLPLLQISFSGIVFPAILTAYIGQAAYLMKFPDHVLNTFYDSIPGKFLHLSVANYAIWR